MSEPFWTPLGGQPVDYKGPYAAGTQYAPGDVVTYGGVTYLAVNPSLGSTPPAASILTPAASLAEVAYQESPGDKPITATSEATAQTVVTAPAFTADGSTYLIEFFAYAVQAPGGSGQNLVLSLWVDGVSQGFIASQNAV